MLFLLLILTLKTSFKFLMFIPPLNTTGLPFFIFLIAQFFSKPDIVNNSIAFSSSILLIKIKSFIGESDSNSFTTLINEFVFVSILINWLLALFEPLNK